MRREIEMALENVACLARSERGPSFDAYQEKILNHIMDLIEKRFEKIKAIEEKYAAYIGNEAVIEMRREIRTTLSQK